MMKFSMNYKIDTLNYFYTQDTMKIMHDGKIHVKRTIKNSPKNNSKITKSIKIFFLTLHLMFGHDFGFGNIFSKKVAKLLKYYSVVLTLTTSVTIALAAYIGQELWASCSFIESVVIFCILKSARYTVYNLVSDIHASGKIADLENETCGVVIAMYGSIMSVAKGSFVAVNYMYDKNEFWKKFYHIHYAFYGLFCLGLDFIPIAQMTVCYYIYGFVNNMNRSLKLDKDVGEIINKYIKVSDCYDKIKRLCDNIILMKLFTYIPKILFMSWHMLYNINSQHEWFSITTVWLLSFHLVIQVLIPALIVHFTKCRLDDILQLLNKWRLFEQNPEKHAYIVRVMKYMKVRCMQYKIWGIIPTDLRLPLTMISICTTYLIVIIQFTHLYD